MRYRGEFFLVIANFIFAFMGVFTRLLNKDLLPITQVTYRLTLASLLYLVIFSIKDTKFLKTSFKNISLLFVAGFFGYGLMVVFAVYSLITTTYSNAITFLQLSSIFVIILGYFLLKEHIKPNAMLACFLSIIGAIVVFRPDFSNFSIGAVYAIVSSLFYSFYFIVIRKLKDLDIRTRLFYSTFFAGVFLIPVVLVFEKYLSFSFGISTIVYLIIMAIMNIVSYYFMNLGLKEVEANVAGILTIVQTLVGIIIGTLLYHEPMTIFEIAGSGLIVLAIIVLNIR
jgi:drug/metabolite transporter (DMT)-like permease